MGVGAPSAWIAFLPGGRPLDLKIGLASGRQSYAICRAGRFTVGLHRELVGPRREIPKELASGRKRRDRCAIGVYLGRSAFDIAIGAVEWPQKPHSRRAAADRRRPRIGSGRCRGRHCTEHGKTETEHERDSVMVTIHHHSPTPGGGTEGATAMRPWSTAGREPVTHPEIRPLKPRSPLPRLPRYR